MRLDFSERQQRYAIGLVGTLGRNADYQRIEGVGLEPLLRSFLQTMEPVVPRRLSLVQATALYIGYRACYERDGPQLATQWLRVILASLT